MRFYATLAAAVYGFYYYLDAAGTITSYQFKWWAILDTATTILGI